MRPPASAGYNNEGHMLLHMKVGGWIELEVALWSLYVRLGRRAVYLAPGLSCYD